MLSFLDVVIIFWYKLQNKIIVIKLNFIVPLRMLLFQLECYIRHIE